MKKILIMTLVKIRWVYFHLNPNYMKFYMDASRTEAHFQHRKTGQLYSNYEWTD